MKTETHHGVVVRRTIRHGSGTIVTETVSTWRPVPLDTLEKSTIGSRDTLLLKDVGGMSALVLGGTFFPLQLGESRKDRRLFGTNLMLDERTGGAWLSFRDGGPDGVRFSEALARRQNDGSAPREKHKWEYGNMYFTRSVPWLPTESYYDDATALHGERAQIREIGRTAFSELLSAAYPLRFRSVTGRKDGKPVFMRNLFLLTGEGKAVHCFMRTKPYAHGKGELPLVSEWYIQDMLDQTIARVPGKPDLTVELGEARKVKLHEAVRTLVGTKDSVLSPGWRLDGKMLTTMNYEVYGGSRCATESVRCVELRLAKPGEGSR